MFAFLAHIDSVIIFLASSAAPFFDLAKGHLLAIESKSSSNRIAQLSQPNKSFRPPISTLHDALLPSSHLYNAASGSQLMLTSSRLPPVVDPIRHFHMPFIHLHECPPINLCLRQHTMRRVETVVV
nr:hypothetical protein CFP56_12142 [Quercus suber]